jgi:hypothetical protein
MSQSSLYPELPPSLSGCYFGTDGIRIKIGFTERPPKRRGGELDLDILFLIPGGPEVEAREHRRWASARIGRTEWFNLTYGLLRYITENTDLNDWDAQNAINCLIENHSRPQAA